MSGEPRDTDVDNCKIFLVAERIVGRFKVREKTRASELGIIFSETVRLIFWYLGIYRVKKILRVETR